MKRIVLSVVAAAALAVPALAADVPVKGKAAAPAAPPQTPVWDVAFGGLIQTDYNFRGISQSNHGMSVGAYVEPRYNITPNLQLYVGLGGLSISWPTTTPLGLPGLSNPAAEIDIYGGIRPTFGPLAFDFGAIYYYYPKEIGFQSDFWEVYGKATYTFNDIIAVGANVYYADSWLNLGVSGTYASGTLKLTAPGSLFGSGIGAYASGELGQYWLGGAFIDYTYWNAGIGFTWKAFTLDLRYHDTSLSKTQCLVNTGFANVIVGAGFGSNWCDQAFIAKLAFDTTVAALK